MRLYIAEKPSLGKAIAAVLPKPHRFQNGYIEVGNGDCVTWCLGHLLEQVPPDGYDEKYKKWRLEDLPILPSQWQLAPRKDTKKQLNVIANLLKKADEIVHAGDPDREGQLLVDEVFGYLKLPETKRQGILRLLIADLNPSAVKKALTKMQPNQQFRGLSVSALARSRADWLYGMNMTRAYTLLGQRRGYQGVLSVGRVQTPILGLVAHRDETIRHFQPKPFYQVNALIPFEDLDIVARWQPSEACAKWQDEDGRVISRKLCENVVSRIQDQPALVIESDRKETTQAPPLTHSLSALQIDAAKRYHLGAAEVLEICQQLYEKHQAITYPRSDCRHLPTGHFSQATAIFEAIKSQHMDWHAAIAAADCTLRSKVWNDKKIEAHHAIIPTLNVPSDFVLKPNEKKVYHLIVRQYLMQFYPPAVYCEAKLTFDIAGGQFVAKGRQRLKAGWRSLLGQEDADENLSVMETVPPLEKGRALVCREGMILDKMTEPPKPFTEATLLQAMTGIARFVCDVNLKKILRETDGLGTEATRAGILALLEQRGLMQKSGKHWHATEAGLALIRALPESSTVPDMTAHWEHQLKGMAQDASLYREFMQTLTRQLVSLLHEAPSNPNLAGLQGLGVKSPPIKAKRRRAPKANKH